MMETFDTYAKIWLDAGFVLIEADFRDLPQNCPSCGAEMSGWVLFHGSVAIHERRMWECHTSVLHAAYVNAPQFGMRKWLKRAL